MYCIFRKSDKVILYITYTIRQLANEKAACVSNEGGVDDDYLVVEAAGPIPPGMVPTLNDSNEVIFVLTPTIVARNAAQASAQTKLQALGFTDEEIKALRG